MKRRRLRELKQLPPPKKLYLWTNCPACRQPAIMRLLDRASWCLAPGCERLMYPDYIGAYIHAPSLPAQE